MENHLVSKEQMFWILHFNVPTSYYIKRLYSYQNGSWLVAPRVNQHNGSFCTDIKSLLEKTLLNELYLVQPELKDSLSYIWDNIGTKQSYINYLSQEFSEHILLKNIAHRLFTNHFGYQDIKNRFTSLSSHLKDCGSTSPEVVTAFTSILKKTEDSTLQYLFLDTWRSLKSHYLKVLTIQDIISICKFTNTTIKNHLCIKYVNLMLDLKKINPSIIEEHKFVIGQALKHQEYNSKIHLKLCELFNEKNYGQEFFTTSTTKEKRLIEVVQDHRRFFLQAESLGLKKSSISSIGFYFSELLTEKHLKGFYDYRSVTKSDLCYKYEAWFEPNEDLAKFKKSLQAYEGELKELQNIMLHSKGVISVLNQLDYQKINDYLADILNKIALSKTMENSLEVKKETVTHRVKL